MTDTYNFPHYSKGRHHVARGMIRSVSEARADLLVSLLQADVPHDTWPSTEDINDTLLRAAIDRQEIHELMS